MQRKTKIKDLLPKIRAGIGGIYKQKVICKKQRCRCATGIRHEAYYYIRRIGGRQIKTYIPKSKVEEISKLFAIAKKHKEHTVRTTKDSNVILRRLRDQLRQNESIISDFKIRKNE